MEPLGANEPPEQGRVVGELAFRDETEFLILCERSDSTWFGVVECLWGGGEGFVGWCTG